jgi:ribonucleotide reductase alpha subunit
LYLSILYDIFVNINFIKNYYFNMDKNLKSIPLSEIQKATLQYFKGDELATDVWIKKYCLKNEKDYFELTPDDMHRRIAKELARIEAKYPNPLSEEEIYETLKNFKRIVPQGSPMSGIGNDNQVTSIGNCFVIGNEYDSYGSIFTVDQEQAQLMKRRGGVGHDLSHIRPNTSPVKNDAISSTGIVPFMERFSNTTKEVAQSGRRGALMLSISIKHPDSEAFIDAKLEQGKVTGANISVRIDDEFMNSVINDTDYTFQFPVNSNKPINLKRGSAKKLWKKIIHNAWKSAEPGILFWDTLRRESIPSCYGEDWKESSTNPCFSGNERLLTKDGYVKFNDLVYSEEFINDACDKNKTLILSDKRISYVNDGKEKPENWKIDCSQSGTDVRIASKAFLTQENAEIIELVTSKGFKLKCTPDHHIATTIGMIEAKDLTPEHKILIAIPKNMGSVINLTPETDEEIIATLIGLITGDGAIDKNRNRVHFEFWGDDKYRMKEFVISLIDKLYIIYGDQYNRFNRKLSKYYISEDIKNNKIRISSAWVAKIFNKFGYNHKTKHQVPNFIMNKSATNVGKFYVAAMMYCDASVQGTKISGFTIRLAQSNLELLEDIQKILHSNGMIFGIYKRRNEKLTNLPNGNGGYSDYKTKIQYELISVAGSFVKYRNSIGFLGHENKENLLKVEHNFNVKESYTDSIIEIRKLNNEPVYCIKEDIGRNIIVNCISARRCGELPLPPYDSCRLLLINLFGYVINPFTACAKFDWELFKKDAIIAEKLMDDIIDLEIEKIEKILLKIECDPEPNYIKIIEKQLWEKIKRKAELGRRTGLGITAEGDMLAALGFRYGTDEATEFSVEVHKTLKLQAYRSSVTMAKERGAFPIYNVLKETSNPFIDRINQEDSDLYLDMIRYGRRNIALLTIAPAGSVSILTQTTSGIEPCYLPIYMRRRKINPQEKDVRIDFVDDEGVAWMEYPVFHHKFEMWLEINGYNVNIVKTMSKTQLDELVKQSPYYKATANDVDWVKKVEMQGKVQSEIDHSISSTINIPNEATEELVSQIYEMGWRSGCKGLTVYRDGSRSGVLVKIEEKKNDIEFHENHAPKRPKRLKGEIIRFQNNLEKWIAVVGMKDGRPYELFTGKFENGLSNLPAIVKDCEIVKNIIDGIDEDGKPIKTKRYDIEYIDAEGKKQTHTGLNHAFNPEFWNYAKFISAVLRHGMPMVYVFELVDSLNFKEDTINTWKNGVARVIKRYIKEGEKIKSKCPECEGTEFIFAEGCVRCANCGWSKC